MGMVTTKISVPCEDNYNYFEEDKRDMAKDFNPPASASILLDMLVDPTHYLRLHEVKRAPLQ